MLKVIVQLSNCCQAPTLLGIRHEYPLGGRTWHQSYRVHACENCLKECDPVDVTVCEYCGEVECDCDA